MTKTTRESQPRRDYPCWVLVKPGLDHRRNKLDIYCPISALAEGDYVSSLTYKLYPPKAILSLPPENGMYSIRWIGCVDSASRYPREASSLQDPPPRKRRPTPCTAGTRGRGPDHLEIDDDRLRRRRPSHPLLAEPARRRTSTV